MAGKSKLHLIGTAHLDPIWLWRWQEGCGEVLQTFRSALDRLNEYSDFIFTCSSAQYYKWVEEIDPGMFEEIRARVKEGRWVPVNGWWIQPDCNIPSVESFARQALVSQLYYYEKFGITCKTGYNVDSFGHNGNLPQLIKQGGMKAYVMMRPSPSENPDIPNTFIWQGVDGTQLPTFKIPDSYTASGPEEIDRAINNCGKILEDEGHGMMVFYGVGNHGGGPTRFDIEYMKERLVREGYAPMKFSNPDKFFESLCFQMVDLPIYADDMQHHASGCYSATSMMKQLNRKAENSLFASEAFSTVASLTGGMKDKSESFREAWQLVCFNQFHDILCGCSIMEAYDDVRDSSGRALDIASKNANEAYLRIAHSIDTWIDGVSEPYAIVRNNDFRPGFPRPVVVFNPLSFPVEAPVRTYHPASRVTDSDGNDVVFQNVRSSRSNDTHLDVMFTAKVPAFGYSVYHMYRFDPDNGPALPSSSVKAEGLSMENENIRVRFDEKTGFIVSLVDKKSGFDYASEAKPVAVPTVIDDRKTDTWAHNVFTFHDIKEVMTLQSVELIETGPARAVIRTKHVTGKSVLTQDFILGEKEKTLRVKCKAIWQENFTMLKMSFPVDGENAYNMYEIPGGAIRRPCNGHEEPAGKFGGILFENGGKKGLYIVNDSKYSYDCPGSDMRITLIRNVIFADHYSHRPKADFNFTDEGLQRFEYGVYVTSGEFEDSEAPAEAIKFNIHPVPVPESFHKGTQKQKKSFISVDKPNVVMTAFKLCEDGSGDVIVRLYETNGKPVRAAVLCDTPGAGFFADFGRYEVKTFRINASGFVRETNFLEGIPD